MTGYCWVAGAWFPSVLNALTAALAAFVAWALVVGVSAMLAARGEAQTYEDNARTLEAELKRLGREPGVPIELPSGMEWWRAYDIHYNPIYPIYVDPTRTTNGGLIGPNP